MMPSQVVFRSFLASLLVLFASHSLARPVDTEDDEAQLDEDTTVVVDVLDNDDANGFGIELVSVDDPAQGGTTSFTPAGEVTYTPPAHVSGDLTFSYRARSLAFSCALPPFPPDCEAVETGVYEVSPVADPPTVVLSNPTGSEDSAISLGISATLVDTDGSQQEATSISGVPNGASISSGADQGGGIWIVPTSAVSGATITPPEHFNGTLTLGVATRTVDTAPGYADDAVTVAHGSVTVTVTAVNDPPVAGTPPVLTTDEDVNASVSLAGVFSDPDIATNGDSLTLSVISVSHAAIAGAGMAGETLNVTLNPNTNGSGTVRVQAQDTAGAQVAVDVTVQVNPVNDPPTTVGTIANQLADEDTGPVSVSLAGVFDDVDIASNGDALTITATETVVTGIFSNISASTSDVVLTLAADQNGTSTIDVVATDSAGASTSVQFFIDIDQVNDQPVVVGTVPSLNLVEDVPGSVSLAGVFDDVDIATNGDSLGLTVQSFSHPAIDVASMGGDVLSVTLLPDLFGTGSVVVRATDVDGLFEEVTVTVNVTQDDDAPFEVAPIAAQNVLEDDLPVSIDVSGVFDDNDITTNGDSLTITVASEPGLGDLFASSTVSGTDLNVAFAPDQNGAGRLRLTATDTSGNTADSLVDFNAAPVNDQPTVDSPIANQNMDEDDPPRTVSVDVFGDVDIATNADVLTYSVQNNTNPGLFSSVSLTGTDLELTLVTDANGSADITIRVEDLAGAFAETTFTVSVNSVNDIPVAAPDVATMDEDGEQITITVLTNDYLAEQPTTITSVNHTETYSYINSLGDTESGPAGEVIIDGDDLLYTPSENFSGTDTFTYTITDSDGDTSTGTVTVTVTEVNDPPTGGGDRSFSVLRNNTLSVPNASDGSLLEGSYDLENASLDADGNLVFSDLTVQIVTVPPLGTFTVDPITGAFTYTPQADWTGEQTFTYRIFDNESVSSDPIYTATIRVEDPPSAPPAPPAGEVVNIFPLAQTPLEQSATVPPNVMVLTDDSGSMDFHVAVQGQDQNGGMLVTNADRSNSSIRSRGVTYLWNIDRALGANSSYGNIAPTEEALEADSETDGNEYGIWRIRNHKYNKMYYNPEVQYQPWVGLDEDNNPFTNANPTAVRIDPVDPDSTFNMLTPHSFTTTMPDWDDNGGTASVTTSNMYIPFYWTTTEAEPLEWDDPHTKVEILDDGTIYAGGPNRDDCRAGDGDPLTCTYDQEIQNFANYMQYYRTRELATKGSLGLVLDDITNIRVGFDSISGRTQIDIEDMNDDVTTGSKKDLIDTIYSFRPGGGTPLRELLRRGARYMGCQLSGDCPALPAPEGLCQQNFALLFTDGYWNGGTSFSENSDADGAGVFDGGRYADTRTSTLADIAMFYYENDLFPTVDNEVPVTTRDIAGVPAGTFDDDDLMHQHVKTYTIAFGATGTIDPVVAKAWNVSNAFAWTNPSSAFQHRLDDVLHAGINGRGDFLSAGNPAELQAALESAFLEFSQASSSASAAAFNSTSLREGTLLYRGFYDLRDRTGELTATEVDTNGVVASTPTWLASEELDPPTITPDDRVIVTWDPIAEDGIPFRHGDLTANQQATMLEVQVDYMRGDRSAEQPSGSLRQRPTTGGLLGPIVNSSPIFVGKPRAINRDQSPYPTDTNELYSKFQTDFQDRAEVVYVGANDGMLHGFDGSTGREVFAYVPNMILDSSKNYSSKLNEFSSPFYYHNYYVDLSVRLNDVYTRRNASATGKSWNTVLVGGLGAGGKGYFALDVTDPDALFADENSATNAVLWEFTDEDDTYPVDSSGDPLGGSVGARVDINGDPIKDLGYATSVPVVQMLNNKDGGSPAQNHWGVIFGNGANATSGVATLFVLFHDLGIDGWDAGDFVKITTDAGVPGSGEYLAGYPNFLGAPTAVDLDLNGTVDLVYAGDRLGNLYRFDLSDSDPDNWDVVRLFTATYDDNGTDVPQAILARPTVIKLSDQPGFMVVFGTGAYLTPNDAANTEIQSIYAIWDRLDGSPATASASTKENNLVERVMQNVVDDSGAENVTRRILLDLPDGEEFALTVGSATEDPVYGWYIDLDMERAEETISGATNPDTSGMAPPSAQFPGEKAIRRIVFRNGALITTTVLPATDEFSCTGVRPGSILIIDALSGGDFGEPIIDFDRDGEIDEGDLVEVDGQAYSGGLLFEQDDLDGALVDLSTLGGEGDVDYLFVSGGNETEAYEITSSTANRTGRLSWVELNDD